MDALFRAAFDHAAVFVQEVADDAAADGVFAVMQDGVALEDEDVLLGKIGRLLRGAVLCAVPTPPIFPAVNAAASR